MKTLFLAILFFLSSTIKANTFQPLVDTIDFWHVYYNNKLIQQYNGYNSGHPLIFKMDSIKPGDSITVKFFRDTPCGECNAYLIIEYPILNRAIIAHGSYTFCPLNISLTDIKIIKEFISTKELFEVYYLEDSNNKKIKLFDIKLE